MRYVILILGAMIMSGCAGHTVIRNSSTYRNEVKFLAEASKRTSDTLAKFVSNSCRCEIQDGEVFWLRSECEDAAKLIQVVRTRVPYHVDMMMFLAGGDGDRPPKVPPVIPDSTDLCPPGNQLHEE